MIFTSVSNLGMVATGLMLLGTVASTVIELPDDARFAVVAKPMIDPRHLSGLSVIDRMEATKPELIGAPRSFLADMTNGTFDYEYVYNDARRTWSMPDKLTFAVTNVNYENDEIMAIADQDYWFREALNKWFDEIRCVAGVNPFEEIEYVDQVGAFQNYFLNGEMDLSLVQADLTTVGFLTPEEFPPFDNSPYYLGVCFTYIFLDDEGYWVDEDGDGKYDAAFSEIYFKHRKRWTANKENAELIDEDGFFEYIDFPTIAIHEYGHALFVDHFGTPYLTEDGRYKYRPRAVMNEWYTGVYRKLRIWDYHGFCPRWSVSPYIFGMDED